MRNKELAIQFLEGFSLGDMDSIKALLAEGFEFNGPYFAGQSAAEYLKALESNPPEMSAYRILSIFESDDEVCLIYRFEKSNVTANMAQIFQFAAGKIVKSTLKFDSRRLG